MSQIPLPRGAYIYTDTDGKERTGYVTTNPDRRTTTWRRMKKHIAEQAALKLKKEQANVQAQTDS